MARLTRLGWMLAFAALMASGVSGVMAYMAIQHNPQEAYCVNDVPGDSCSVRWGPVGMIALSWWVPVFALSAGPLLALGVAPRRSSRKEP